MKDEGKKVREYGHGSARALRTETIEAIPLVSAKRGKFESLNDTKIEAMVFAQLKDYKLFVREIEGEEPEDGAIVSAALEMLFNTDKGFERWRQNERKKLRQSMELASPKTNTRTTSFDTSQT